MRALLSSGLAVLLVGCTAVGATDDEPVAEEEADVRVASGPDAETALLAQVMAELLGLAELRAEVVPYADARDARQALDLGAVDVRPAYTGEAWLETLGRADPPGDARESFVAVRDHDREQGVAWFQPRFLDGPEEPPANATFAFVVAGPPSADADLATVSQLATRLSERADATLCVDHDFASRADGLRAVLAAYSVRSDQPVLAAEPDETVGGVIAGDCIAGLTTATDGAAWLAGLHPLEDDLEVFPAFVVVPQVRQDAIDEHPAIRGALGPLSAHLSTRLLGSWNARVVAGDPLEEVAEDAARSLYERSDRQLPDED